MTKVSFPDPPGWDGALHAVMFHALIGGSVQVACLVSSAVLRDRFAALAPDPTSCLEAFRLNRHRIEEIAVRLIQMRRFEADGSILIRAGDV